MVIPTPILFILYGNCLLVSLGLQGSVVFKRCPMSIINIANVRNAIQPHIVSIERLEREYDSRSLEKNTLDCFGAVIDSAVQQISLTEWREQEKSRQIQKSKQNILGALHEDLLSCIEGVERVEVGGIYDIRCNNKRLIAEVKNKHNTTKGNHKNQIYKDAESVLGSLPGFTAYYVEMLPKNGKRYNKPFIPPNNRTHSREVERSDIRVVDGKTFYEIITGEPDYLDKLYGLLPEIIDSLLFDINQEKYPRGTTHKLITNSPYFTEMYKKIYS